MKTGLSAELLLVLRVDEHSRLPVSTATCLLTSCRRESGEQLSCALAGFANPVSQGGSRRPPLRDGSLYRRTGQHGAGPFQCYRYHFEVRVPDCTGVLELWTDQAFVCVSLTSDLQFQRFLRSRPNVLLDLYIYTTIREI